jgi:guanine deaminase
MTERPTVIRGGLVLHADGQASQQDVLIEDGRIVAIENPGFAVSEDADVISANDRLLIPGLISAHTHSHGALNRGAVDDKVSLEMFLTGAGASTRARATNDKYLSAALSAAEMIRKGCTACFDLTVEFLGPSQEGISAVASAYRDAGMRAVVAPMIADRTIYQALPGLLEALPDNLRTQVAKLSAAPIEQTLSACVNILANWEFDRRWIRPALGPTIPLHCSDELLTGCARRRRWA